MKSAVAVQPPGLAQPSLRSVAGGLFSLSIRGKIALAFISIAVVVGAIGWFASWSVAHLGGLVVETYDKPLQSISFARAIHADFASMEAAFTRRVGETEPAAQARLDADIEDWSTTLTDDLAVVAERATSQRVRESVSKVAEAVAAWQSARTAMQARRQSAPDWSIVDASAAVVREQIDLLVNYAAGDGFRQRKQTQLAIDENRTVQIAGAVIATLVAAVVMFSLARRIVKPLAIASQAASRIAQGDLDTRITISGRDELAALLSAMTVMRDRIRDTVEDERSQRRSAQNRLVDAIECSSEGFVLIGPDEKILLSNAEISDFCGGASKAPRSGDTLDEAASRVVDGNVFQADSDPARLKLLELLRGIDPIDTEAELADGRWVRMSRSRSSDGGAIFIVSDITLMKEREQVLREAAERAEASNLAKTEFLAKMSHELRTPLNSIIGFSELIAGEVLGPLGNAQYKDFATDISSGGHTLLGVINDILTLVKSEIGDLSINRDDVDLSELIEEAVPKVRALFDQAGVTLEVDASPHSLVAYGDRARLRQIAVNLLSNAAKFTQSGGVVRVWAFDAGRGHVGFAVSDTGIGMSDAEIPIALSAFGQIDATLTRRFEGTGLGLTLAKALAELHDGDLAIDSIAGQGTTVTVTLPRVSGVLTEAA